VIVPGIVIDRGKSGVACDFSLGCHATVPEKLITVATKKGLVMRNCYTSMVLLLVGFCLYTSAHAADKIRIGFPDLAAPCIPLAIADKRNFFQEEGIQAESIRMNPAVALQALVGGEIDYYPVLGLGVAAAIRGVPVKLVAAFVPVSPTAMIVRPEIKTVGELRGKPSASMLTEALLRQWAR